jgi:NFU1 iron-sulfur cluster scaffold homolog, mitochondrial
MRARRWLEEKTLFEAVVRPREKQAPAHTHARAHLTLRPRPSIHPHTTQAAWTAPPRFAAARPATAAATTAAHQSRSLYIQTQETPNPASLMFLPGQAVLGAPDASSSSSPAPPASAHFSSAREAAAASPLAAALFRVDGVTAVFLGSDFLTVTKAEGAAWAEVKPGVFAAITEHFASGLPALRPLAPGSAGAGAASSSQPSDTAPHPDDSETVAMIKELLDTRIRPAVAEDGGDIAFAGFDPDTGTVSLRLQGACSGCPSSSITLKSGIENMLQHYIPEVKQVVEAPPDEAASEGLAHFKRVEDLLST